MAKKAPGKYYREGISLVQAFKKFPDDKTAEQWFASVRWPNGISCPHCESDAVVNAPHPRMPYRCKKCRKFFSVRTGTVMQSSKLGYQVWGLAMYILRTGIKGTSSMKLHRDFGITQKSAWHLAHRIKECWRKSKRLYLVPLRSMKLTWAGKKAIGTPRKRGSGAGGLLANMPWSA